MSQLKMFRTVTPAEYPAPVNGFTFRRYNHSTEDVNAWAEICRNGLIGPDTPSQQVFDACLTNEKGFHPEDLFFVMLDGKHVATICVLLYENNVGWVHMVAASPECRGKGVAKILMDITAACLYEHGCVYSGLSTAATPVFLIYVASIFYNFGFSGPGFVINNIQPDITDVDELITGRRREGVISTFNSFLKKTSLSLSSGALGYMLHYMGYDPAVAEYTKLTTTAEFGIRLAVSWLPAIFMVIALILTFRYKMRKRDHEIIQDVIRQKHETGTCEISESDKERLEEIAGQSWDDMWIGKSDIIKKKQDELANI